MEEFVLNNKELNRLHAVKSIIDKKLTIVDASKVLSLSTRQVSRLVLNYKKTGTLGIISKRKGKVSNRAYSREFKDKVISLLQKDYIGYGPTLAAEKLLEHHNISLSKETLRKWMIEFNLWVDKKKKAGRVHQSRNRRPYHGELIQVDGSDHHWLSDDKRHSLLVFIDDATSKIMELRLVEAETTSAYFWFIKKVFRASRKTYGVVYR